MKWIKKNIIIGFGGANFFNQIVFAICELVVLKVIEPSLIGIWQFVILIQSYSYISRLGIVSAINRELPYELGKNNLEKSNEIFKTGLTFSLLNALILFIFFLLLFFFYGDSSEWKIAFFTMSLIVVFEMISTYYESCLKSLNKFDLITKYLLLLIPLFILTLYLPISFDFIGLCIRVLLISFIKFLILQIYANRFFEIRSEFKLKIFSELFSVGWKMWLWGYLKNFNKSIPKLIIGFLESTLILGLYTPIHWMKTIFYNFSVSISSYIYPNLSFQLAKNKINVSNQALRISFYTSLFSIPFILVGYFLLPLFIDTFLENYSLVIRPMQIALISSFFEIFLIGNMAFAVLKAWRYMYFHIIIVIISRFSILYYFYFTYSDKLLGIAYGLLYSSIVIAFITIIILLKLSKKNIK